MSGPGCDGWAADPATEAAMDAAIAAAGPRPSLGQPDPAAWLAARA